MSLAIPYIVELRDDGHPYYRVVHGSTLTQFGIYRTRKVKLMVRSVLVAAVLLLVTPLGICQNAYLDQLKDAYAKSGEIEYVNGSLAISPTMPSPLLFLPTGGTSQNPKWSVLSFPVAQISADLQMIDETSIDEMHAFSAEDFKVYKDGDRGSLTAVSIKSTNGRPFLVAEYDLDKLNAVFKAGTRQITGEAIGETREYRDTFTVLFESTSDARKFETALKNAVIVAKAQPTTK